MSIPPRTAPSAGGSLEVRLAEVEDRLAIRDLTARYNFETDNRRLDAVGALFTPDAAFGSQDGVMRTAGREAIVKLLGSRFSVMGATNHFAHDHVVWFDSPTRARGLLSAHAELWRNERAVVAALRYDDIYEKQGGVWYFAQRLLSYMYYLPVEEYASALGELDRNRASTAPTPADYPERLASYVEYRPAKVRTP
jgi:hypothetical protein